MGFFSNLVKLIKKESTKEKKNDQAVALPAEVEKLLCFERLLNSLLAEDRYIAKSDYKKLISDYFEVHKHFLVIRKGEILPEYCNKYAIDEDGVILAIETYEKVEEIVDKHNAEYIEKAKSVEKKFLDNILQSIDPNIMLDENQREVVLADEDYSLVIAGAGAGKTTTVAAKVKYLVEKKRIDPKQILVISFTNKAVDELKEKINKALLIDCPITTFHSAGNAIIRKRIDQKLNIVDSSKLYFVLMDYFRGNLLQNERMVNNLILFFGSYFDAPYEGDDLNSFFNSVAKARYETLKSDLNEYIHEISDARSKKKVTIANEILRSKQEVEIANYLYLNNIDYQYEPIYPFNIQFARKPYTPDFVIRQGDHIAYIEHFGISESGVNDRYSKDEIESYKKAIRDKILLHRQHGTTLIHTFSKYNDQRSLLDHLKEQLEGNGFELSPRSQREIVEKLVVSEQSRYIRRLVDLVCRFITNFKTNAYENEDFLRMSNSTNNVRTKLFLDICQGCYLEYQRYLTENDAVDFQDMINESARILREVKEMKQKLDFKYIIVDEYQDISRQRFDLTKELSTVTDAKIIAVGDDWQSIYAFSGSDISLFTNFCEKMGYGKLLKIVNTYRNAQEVIDIAGNFIQKNASQIQKALISPKRISDPVIIYTYDSTRKSKEQDNRSGVMYAIAHAVEVALEQIIAYNSAEGKGLDSNILLLGRFGFDGDNLERSGLFQYITRGSKIRSVKYPKMDITFMTAHSSKGLGYDNVIVINGRNETYGFPSKIEDDPVLKFVIREDSSIEYAEERRLFYVAMTRTKNRVFFIAPEQNPSEFLLEIKRDYKSVLLRGNWNEQEYQPAFRNICPVCGYPLQFRYKNAYGLRLYICTNEPELCSFLSNNLSGKKMSIQKCDRCADGYLVVKRSNSNQSLPFLGCTNYSRDRKGCNNSLTMQAYYSKYGLKEDPGENIPDRNKTVHENNNCEQNNILNSQSNHSTISKVEYSETKINEPGKQTTVMKISTKTAEAPEAINLQEKASIESVQFNGADMLDIIGRILHCVAEISEKHFFGKGVLLNVLRGSSNKKILEYMLEQTSEYGKLSNIKREDLELIIDWLISNEFLLQRNSLYPVVHSTYNGTHFKEIITNTQLKNLARSLLENSPDSKFSIQDKSLKSGKAYPISAGMRWEAKEDKQLLEEIDSGLKVSEIAKIHNRSYGAIKSRIIKLTEENNS
jgi:DNA helicase-4